MSRLEACFKRLKEARRKALIPFITAGDPNIAVTEDLMHTLVDAGADVLELGVPFSDPMADGPVIQKASERALEVGTTISDVLDLVQRFRVKNTQTPVVLMGYLNPIEVTGYKTFMARAQQVGVDGLLTVDMPIEEAQEVLPLMEAHGIEPIFLIAPTTTPARMKKICAQAKGFVYYVSLKGVTGAGVGLDVDAVAQKVAQIRCHTALPINVGFGIKDGATAAAVGGVADGVVVGSALVNTIERYGKQPERLLPMIKKQALVMREALDSLA